MQPILLRLIFLTRGRFSPDGVIFVFKKISFSQKELLKFLERFILIIQ